MDERMRSFIERLNFGQPYLLLGQQYLAETITDKLVVSLSFQAATFFQRNSLQKL